MEESLESSRLNGQRAGDGEGERGGEMSGGGLVDSFTAELLLSSFKQFFD